VNSRLPFVDRSGVIDAWLLRFNQVSVLRQLHVARSWGWLNLRRSRI